ncbi:hypothetical protein QYM36_000683 [Artemia franciscana]|uniref:Uncharacterized protein n=1 Tax=Artemia franciscana TaxID=6661 RepID=A0AA88IRD6_ARTSF|nr:hypothetical protein QYM36_000683 [Artemia franciscana]
MEGTGRSTCEETFSLSLEQQSAKSRGALESAVGIKFENCSNKADEILCEYSHTREDPINENSKKKENLTGKYFKAKSTKSPKRVAAKSGTSKKEKQLEGSVIAEDCNKEGFGEDFQRVGARKLETNLPKLSRKDKKKLKKQKENDQNKSAASKIEGSGPSAFEETFSLSLEQYSAKT